MFNPYIEAEKINKIISEFVDQHKVTKDSNYKVIFRYYTQ